MIRPLLVALAILPFSCHAQNVLEITRALRQRAILWLDSEIHEDFRSLAQSNQFFGFDDFLGVVDASRVGSLSPECSEDMRALVEAHSGKFEYPEFVRQVWLPMRDSAGHVGPAVLKGHLNFVGHYSECVQIDVRLTGRDRRFVADYFRVDVDLLLRSNQRNDSCAPVWSFGICLPASCTSTELESLFISENAKHNPFCRIHRTNDAIPPLDAGFYVTVSIMGAIFAICVVSGIADFFLSDHVNDKQISKSALWQAFMSFSLYANVVAIFDTSRSKKDGQIGPIHCIRFFSMCWVVLGHLAGTVPGVVANPLDIVALTKDLTTQFIINAFFSVDSFFFVGGLLLTFLWFKSYNRNPKQTNSLKAWVMVYVHRFLRLSPPYFMMVLFFTFVFKQFYRNSPVNITLENQSDSCRETWWLEFTYLHNIVDNDNQCLGYSWYLATDFQMFFFSPLIIVPLALKPVIGLCVAAVIFAISSALNILMVYHYHWPANYEVYMYYSPVTRCQVYIIGMLVGWLLQAKRRMRIIPVINLGMWLATFALMLTLILGLHSQMTGQLMPIFWRAMYSAFSKPAWALALSWIIISCYYGYGGPITSFMSWQIWVPLGRLSYCGYLIHFPMIFIVLVQTHDEIYFSSFTDFAITRLLPISALIYFVSIFWSACFEISFGKLEMRLCGRFRKQPEETRQRKLSKSDAEMLDDSFRIRFNLFGGRNGRLCKSFFPWIAKYEETGRDYVETNDFRVLCLRLVQTVAIFLDEMSEKRKVEIFLYKLGQRHVDYLPKDMKPEYFDVLREAVHDGFNDRMQSLTRRGELTTDECSRAIQLWHDTVVYIFDRVREGFFDGLNNFDRFPGVEKWALVQYPVPSPHFHPTLPENHF